MKINKDDFYYCIPVLGTAIGLYQISSSLKAIVTQTYSLISNKIRLNNYQSKKINPFKIDLQKNINLALSNISKKINLLFVNLFLLFPTIPGIIRLLFKKYNHDQITISLNLAKKKFQQKEYSEALPLFEKAAHKGSLTGAKMAGKIYLKDSVKKSYTKSLEYLSRSANRGDVDSQKWIGFLYYRQRVPSNKAIENAVYWFSLAGDQGSKSALFQLGEIYSNNNEVEQNLEQAFKYYLKAAEKGHLEASHKVSKMLLNKQGDQKATADAVSWLRKSALSGHLPSQYMLAQMYEKGKHVSISLNEAFKFYLLAANKGHLESQKKVAHMYRHGEGVELSLEEGYKWSTKAAEQNDPESIFNVGFLLENGKGVKASQEKAIEHYQRAIQMSNPPSQAYYRLGMIHHNKGELKKALEYFHIILEKEKIDLKLKERTENEVKAITKEINSTPEKIIERLIERAEKGEIKQQVKLATYYLKGENLEQDIFLATKWFLKALTSGSADAEEGLTLVYSSLKKLDSSLQIDIFNLFNQEEYKDLKFINFLLAKMYWRGYGVKQLPEKVIEKLEGLIKQNYTEAKYELADLLLRYGDICDPAFYKSYKKLKKTNQDEAELLKEQSIKKVAPRATTLIVEAANEGFSIAQYLCAMMYLEPKDKNPQNISAEDKKKGIAWLKHAADQQHLEATLKLAEMYRKGVDGALPSSKDKAIELYDKVATRSPEAVYWLDVLLK